MALPSSFTMLPIHISNPPKPKSFIICATPKRRKTSTGSGGKINSVLKISTRSIVGVKDVNDSNTTTVKEIIGEYDHKSQANVYDGNHDNDDGSVKGTELPTD
ncbi:hypothetical protein E1A91_D05G382800v1 [Gossypium mustelinum]|uniref:Uncharacterized protein n=2 Tax=Gossypium TaxID=3633 RepID=A0A5D2V617_GOSMU|nr:hypothetical protein ES332_D05G395700v1 [Gossypium tomentosum]TYI84682.1 hypothetical protein E1A91_D05G382800v1 [Gossypium mustelinum]